MLDLSVVIPTLGRRGTLPRVLECLGRQDGGRFEVLIVADALAPGAVADGCEAEGFPLRLLRAGSAGASAARNAGWREAAAPRILFLGDDILPARRLVAQHVAAHDREPGEMVGVLGHVRWAKELRPTPFMRWLEHGIQFDYPAIAGRDAGWGRLYTANVSLKRTALEAVGGFDERLPFLYEDLDLGYRLSAHGFRLRYERRAEGEHLHPADLDSWRQRMRALARAEREFVALHPEQEPWFRRLMAEAARRPPARGRGRHLLRFVPPGLPWLGPRVWASADLYFRQALAPAFLEAWEEAGGGDQP